MKEIQGRRKGEEENMLMNKAQKFEQEKEEKIKMYEERVIKNVDHVEQLLAEKEKQNERKVQFIEKKKKFEDVKKKIKEKYEE